MKPLTAKQLEKLDANQLRLFVIKIQESHEREVDNIQAQHRKQLDYYYNVNRAEKAAHDIKKTKKLLDSIASVQLKWSEELKELGFSVEREDYY